MRSNTDFSKTPPFLYLWDDIGIRFYFYSLEFFYQNPILLFGINTYQFLIIGIFWKITEKDFNDTSFPIVLIGVDPNNWILSNNLLLILKTFMNIFTWTSGCIKYTDWIIILIYWSCIWPHLWFFNWSNVLTTFLIIHFSPWQNLCFFLAMTYFSLLCLSSISSLIELSVSVVTFTLNW